MLTYRDSAIFASSGFPVLKGFGIRVSLEGEAPKRLVFRACEKTGGANKLGIFEEYALQFQDGTEPAEVSVSLKLRCYEDVLLGFVEGRIHGGHPFISRKSFSARQSIVITIEEMEGVSALLANYQHNDWWTRPHFDPDPAKLPARTLSLLWRTDSSYYRLLPVCGPIFRTDLAGGGSQNGQGFSVILSSYQGGLQRKEGLAFVLGGGTDPYMLAERTTEAALMELDEPVLMRKHKRFPEVLDYLGWCSWDAFYQKVDAQGVLEKAEEFGRLELPVRWMMIDDGWSTTSDGKLQAFDADRVKFPEGLAHTVQLLKERHGVRWVGVWHTIVGYWGGVHPESPMAKSLGKYLYTAADGSLLPYPDPALGFGFWNAWHGYLRRQGIDFVKVDSQAAINNYLQYERSIGASASAVHQALEASAALHFNSAMINCMGMAPENIWHRPKSAVSRNSDDFMPKSRNGFPEHALQNAYNSYYHGPFYWGDWDMFWTVHPNAVQHAVLRAVSGGPVYISDPVGRTDPSQLLPLVYHDGRLLRCERTAVPTADCLTQDPTSAPIPLKLWNYAGEAGLVAAFHMGGDGLERRGVVSAADVPGLSERRIVLYEHFSRAGRVLEAGEAFPFVLQPEQCFLFLLVAVRSRVTPLGLTEKYVSSHAVLDHSSRGNMEFIRLREGGRFAFYSETAPTHVLANGEERPIAAIGNALYEVDCGDQPQEVVVEVALPAMK